MNMGLGQSVRRDVPSPPWSGIENLSRKREAKRRGSCILQTFRSAFGGRDYFS